MKTRLIALPLILGVLFFAGEASALGLKIQGNFAAGLAGFNQDDTEVDYDSSFGLGFGGALLLEWDGAMAGPYFQHYTSADHTADSLLRAELELVNNAFGVMLKKELALMMFQFNLGFVTGDANLDVIGFRGSVDTSGVNVGAALGLSIPIVPLIFSVDIAPYIQYMRLWPEDDQSNIEPGNHFQGGIMVQAVFGLAL